VKEEILYHRGLFLDEIELKSKYSSHPFLFKFPLNRLQRAQEERSRRNTNRYYDESTSLTTGEINGNYRNGTTNNHSLSSSSSYLRRGDQTSYIQNNASNGQPNLNSYAPHANMIAAVNGSTPAHLAYFQPNSVI
jgi:hypothetical protein